MKKKEIETGDRVVIKGTIWKKEIPLGNEYGDETYGDLIGREGTVLGFNFVGAARVKTTSPSGIEVEVNCAPPDEQLELVLSEEMC